MSDVHIDAIPLTLVLTIAGFGSLVLGTLLAGTLNRERDTLALSWTRPIARERMAATMMAIDLGGVVAAFAITLVLGLIPLVTLGLLTHVVRGSACAGRSGQHVRRDRHVVWHRAGGDVLVPRPRGARRRAQLARFGLLLVLGRQTMFGPVVQALAAVAQLSQPARLSAIARHHQGRHVAARDPPISHFPKAALTAMAWALGIAACAVAIAAWKRSEA